MRKIIALLLMTCITLGCFTGCGGREAAEEAKGPAEGMTTVWKKVRMHCAEPELMIELGRNEYGFNTTRTSFGADGKVMDGLYNVAYGTEKYDENGKLISYSNNTEGFDFSYDDKGKINIIDVHNNDQTIMFSFGYSDREDAKYVRTGSNARIHYNEDLNIVCEEEFDNSGNEIIKKCYIYNERGLVAHYYESNYDNSGKELHEEVEYDENDNWIKATGYLGEELFYKVENTYSEKGNLLTKVGLQYGQGLSLKGEEYLREEYTDADYDEQGRCNYHYNTGEKGMYDETWTYEYADEGWLLKETSSKGSYTIFDKAGNVIEKYTFGGTYTFEYEEFEIIDDELLVAFYKYYGDEIM